MKEGGLFNRYKFVDDYVLREELDINGKKVKKVYYNADYYVTAWTEEEYKAFRRTAVIGTLFCLAASLFTLSVVHEAMTVAYVILGFVVSVFMSMLMIGSIFQLPKDNRPMERCQRSLGFDKFGARVLINFAAGFYGGVMNTVYAFILFPKKAGMPAQHPGMDIAVSLCGFAIAAVCLYCYKKLKTADIRVSDKENEWNRLCRELEKAEEEADEEAKEGESFPG